MGFFFVEESHLFEQLDGGFAGFESVQTGKSFSGELGHFSRFINDFGSAESVAKTDFEIGFIMGRGDFENTGSELKLDVIVCHDGNPALFIGHIDG
jgi:hypothetical protein